MAQTAAQKKAAAEKKAAAKGTSKATESAAPEVATKKVELLRKITSKTVLGAPFLKVIPEEAKKLYTLMGVISGYDQGQTEYGAFLKFKGDFVATTEDGREFRAPQCIVPVPMDDVLAGMYDKAVADMVDPDTGEMPSGKRASCQFAVEVGYFPAETPTGYQWSVTPLIKMQENDAITNLKAQLLALPAA